MTASISIRPQPRQPWAGVAGLVFLFSMVSGCAYPTLREIAPEINKTRTPSPVFLVAGDQLRVTFPAKPAWDHTAVVRFDGTASFLFLGELSVGGLTVPQLETKLTEELGKKEGVLEAVELTVSLTDIATRNVMVMGEVGQPGPVPIERGHLSFLEAIGAAGGPDKATADLDEVLLVRWLPQEGKMRVWNFDADLENWQSGTPLLLQEHDVIFIPNNTIDKINIWVDKYIRQNIPLPGFTGAAGF